MTSAEAEAAHSETNVLAALGNVEDLAELAFASGVSASALRAAAQGQALLGSAHLEALRRVRPQLDLSLLERHAPPQPRVLTTRRGTLPQGCRLRQVPVDELSAGDYLSYVPPRAAPGLHWITFERVGTDRGAVRTVYAGGCEVVVDPRVLMRIARPIVSGEPEHH